MLRRKSVGLGVVSVLFSAIVVAACSASGNDVAGQGGGTGTGATDSGGAGDTGYGGGDSAVSGNDSGKPADSGVHPVIDSGGGSTSTPADAGPGTTCDIGSQTTALSEIVTFIAVSNPASCDSSDPCAAGSCCLDIAAASGGGAVMGGETGICLTDLSALGL